MNKCGSKKIFKTLFFCSLIIFMLCACNKPNDSGAQVSKSEESNGNIESTENIENKEEKIDEQDEPNEQKDEVNNDKRDEALSKTADEIKMLTSLDDVETSLLYNIGDIYYIKAKIHNLELKQDFSKTEDSNIKMTKYEEPYQYPGEEKEKDYYEVWRYEDGDLKRILFNIAEVKHNKNGDSIIINGKQNSYFIKLDDTNGEEKILYECPFTDILEKENYTCYINDFFSVCVVDNAKNEIILNKFTDDDEIYFSEDFARDNNRTYFESRYSVVETGWIKDSNMAYYACYDLAHIYYIVDIDKKIVYEPCASIDARSPEGFINKDKGYILTGDTFVSLDTDGYTESRMAKKNQYLYLINLHTSEVFEIGKSILTTMSPEIENDNTLIYYSAAGERIEVDISDMIGKERRIIRDNITNNIIPELKGINSGKVQADRLIIWGNKYYMTVNMHTDENGFKQRLIYCDDKNSYTILTEEADSIKINKFGDFIYAEIDRDGNKSFIQYDINNNQNIIADQIEDINFNDSNKYVSIYKGNGDIAILDQNGNKYIDLNAFDYINSTSQGNISKGSDGSEIGVTVWGKNSDKLYILTKKDDRLNNMFEISLLNKSVRDLAYDIDCHYENIYIDIISGYAVYSTLPVKMHFGNIDENFNDDVFLYIKYFNTGEIEEITHLKGENIYFYIDNNDQLQYYSYEENSIRGSYKIK